MSGHPVYRCPQCNGLLADVCDPHCVRPANLRTVEGACPGWVNCRRCQITIDPGTGRWFPSVIGA